MKSKYGDLNNQNNKIVKLVPYLKIFVDRYSKTTQPHIFNKLADFAMYCRDYLNKDLMDVKSIEILEYFQTEIDQKKDHEGNTIQKATKIKYRHILNSYYNFLKELKVLEDEDFKNPVPKKEIWDFSGKLNSLDILELESEIMDFPDIERIFEYLYYTKPKRIFIVMSLILYSGARASEVLHIKTNKIDINDRWFITQIKSRKTDKRDGIYFFPEFFKKEMENYMMVLNLEHPGSKYLFPQGQGHLGIKSLDKHMRDVKKALGLRCRCNPHAFRDFLNTKRIEMRATKEMRKLLLNQKSGDVNITHYAKKYKNRIHLRNLYDKYNPFTKVIKPEPQILS